MGRHRVFACLALMATLTACLSHHPQPVPGTRLISLSTVDGQRDYWLHTPESNVNAGQPLVIVLHGTGSNGEQMLHIGDFVAHADREGYVVAAPDSLGRAFNEGSGRIGEDFMDVNDVTFIEQVIDDAEGRANIDPDRVFVEGFSSGGAMAQRFALESKRNIAGIASVSGHLWAPDRKDVTARPLMLIFGDTDPLNPIEGGPVRYGPHLVLDKPPQRITALNWAQRFDCVTSVRASINIITHRGWYGCRNNVRVVFLQVQGLGHFWPGGPVKSYPNLPESVVGPYEGRMNATSVIWDFFMKNAP